MSSSLKRLFAHSGVYAIGTALSTGVLFFLLPLLTRFLSAEEFGIFETLSPVLGILTIVSTLGLTSALLKTHERDVINEEEKKRLIGTTLLFVLAFASLFTGILFVFREPIAMWLLETTDRTSLISIILTTNWLLAVYVIGLAVLRTKERSRFFSFIMIVRAALLLVLNVLLLTVFKLGLEAVLIVQLVTNAVADVLLIPTFLRSATFSFSPRLFKRLASFGLAVFPAQIAIWFMDLSDRFFLKEALSFEEVGYYSLSYRIGTMVNILMVAPFQLAWPTYSYSIADSPEAKEKYANALTYFVYAGLVFALALSLFSTPLVRLLGTEAYLSAVDVVPFVAIGYVLFGMHFVLTTGIHLANKSRWYPLFVVLPAVINIGLNMLLVPRYGMIAAAGTTLLSFLFVVLLTYVVTQRFYPVCYAWRKLLLAFGVFAVVFSVSWWTTKIAPETISLGSFIYLEEYLIPLPFIGALALVYIRLSGIPLREFPRRVSSLVSRM